jgi:hypothetical protein
LPEFTDYYMQNRTYRYFTGETLYPFGFGLSYTAFEYKDLLIPFNDIELCHTDTLPVIYTLKNTGNRDGDEVVQLYEIHKNSKFTQPIKQLKGFKRIHLKENEEIRDTIFLSLKELFYYDTIRHSYYIESGLYNIQIGASSSDIRLEGDIHLINCLDEVDQFNPENRDKIYPNPADDEIYIEFNSIPDEKYEISICDIFGIKISSNNSNLQFLSSRDSENSSSEVYGNKFNINCASLINGVYIIRLENKTNIFYKKFIIAR